MTEHEQEILLRGTTPVPEPKPKPWAELNSAQAEARYGVLRDVKSLLEHQLIGVTQEMTHLRIHIMELKLGRVVKMAEVEGLGSNGLPKAKLHEALGQIPLPIAPPGETPEHFQKPYSV